MGGPGGNSGPVSSYRATEGGLPHEATACRAERPSGRGSAFWARIGLSFLFLRSPRYEAASSPIIPFSSLHPSGILLVGPGDSGGCSLTVGCLFCRVFRGVFAGSPPA